MLCKLWETHFMCTEGVSEKHSKKKDIEIRKHY